MKEVKIIQKICKKSD